MLIGAGEDVADELGLRLDREHESIENAALLRELELERAETPVRPLIAGEWE